MLIGGKGSVLGVSLAFLSVLMSACSGGDGKGRTATPAGVTATPSPPETAATRPAEATPTPVSTAGAPIRYAIANGEALPSENGLLFINLESGGMQFWTIPGRYAARPISRDGRWVAWSSPPAVSSHLLDTRSGRDRALELEGQPAEAIEFSPDGQRMVLRSSSAVALAEIESGSILASASKPVSAGINGAAVFSADGSAAQGFGDNQGGRMTAVLRGDGSSFWIEGAGWPLRWSPEGDRLAVTTAAGVRIVSSSGDLLLDISLGGGESGFNPRWSPDGRYLAVANPYNVGGQRVFDASTGKEVLRTAGTGTCLGDYWLDDGTLEYGWDGQRVSVPSGKVLDGTPRWPIDEGFTFDQSAAAAGLTRLLLKNGKAVAFRSQMWAFYYDGEGVRSTTSNGEALFLIGIGGKGLCDATLPPLSIQLPPFHY